MFTDTNDSSHKLYSWLCWLLASSFIFYKYVLQVSPSVMVPQLMRDFDLTGQAMGSLSACFFYAYFFMQLPAGMLLDRFNVRFLLTIAISICAVGAFIFSHASELALAQFGRVLIGIGGAFSAVGTMKIISLWFEPRLFALVSGLMMTMAMLGAIAGAAPLSYLIGISNWRDAIQICGILGVCLSVAIFLIVRSPKGAAPTNIAKVSFKDSTRALLCNKQNWLISIYSGLAFAPITAFSGLWGIPFITEKYALTQNAAAGIISLSFVGFALGAPFSGWLSDRLGLRKPIMVTGSMVSLVTLSLIIFASLSVTALEMLVLLFGLFTGFFFVSFAHIRESNPHELSGTSIGFINMFDAMIGALAEPLIGKCLDLHWHGQMVAGARHFTATNYELALGVLPIGLLTALVTQVFIKETYCKSKVE